MPHTQLKTLHDQGWLFSIATGQFRGRRYIGEISATTPGGQAGVSWLSCEHRQRKLQAMEQFILQQGWKLEKL